MLNNPKLILFSLLIILILGLLFNYQSIQDKINLNMVALSSTESEQFSNFPYSKEALGRINEAGACRISWYRGFIQDKLGNIQDRNRFWGEAAACNPDLVYYLFNLYPQDEQLALHIHNKQPGAAESWFWLGDLNPEMRLDYYMQGTRFGTKNGRRWTELGRMLAAQGDLTTALRAFLQSCYNGDPGHNGCWSAGNTAYELGDIESAIAYYRLSRWSVALDRAKELEAQVE